MDFAILLHHIVKIKESENIYKYLDLAKDLKKCGTCGWRRYQL